MVSVLVVTHFYHFIKYWCLSKRPKLKGYGIIIGPIIATVRTMSSSIPIIGKITPNVHSYWCTSVQGYRPIVCNPLVYTIKTVKPEISIRKPNGACYSVLEVAKM